jgi:hypothetical protein
VRLGVAHASHPSTRRLKQEKSLPGLQRKRSLLFFFF